MRLDVRMLALAVCVAASEIGAQTPDTTSDAPVNLWASMSLGLATSVNQRLAGAQFALWASRGPIAVALRSAAATDIDVVDTYDTALLIGLRRRSNWVTAVAAIGPGVIIDHGGNTNESDIGLAFSGELAASTRFVGAGVAAFAALGRKPRLRFAGIGLTLEFGKIR